MTVKTSIARSKAASRAAGNRSQAIEAAVLEISTRRDRAAQVARDRELIDLHADALNREALDVLDFQANL